MAKVKEFDGNTTIQAVIEDPRPGVESLYFFGRRYDKNTLSPKFDQTINAGREGTTTYNAGTRVPSNSPSTYGAYRYNNGGWLSLSKGTTAVPGYTTRPTTVSRSDQYHLDPAQTFWLDDNTPWNSSINHVTSSSGTQAEAVTLVNNNAYANQSYGVIWCDIDTNTHLHEKRVRSEAAGQNQWNRFYYLPKLTDNDYSFVAVAGNNGSSYDYPTDHWRTKYDYSSAGFSSSGDSSTYIGTFWKVQCLGYSTQTNEPLFICNYRQNASTPYFSIVRFNHSTTTTPNVTQLVTWNGTAVSAGGTNAGGTSSTTNYRNMLCSHWYDDPRVGAGTRKVLYKPWFDSYNNFHPTVITWDQTTDTFAREDDVAITGDLSSVHSDISNIFNESGTAQWAMDHFTLNETFVSGGVRYITVMHFQYQDCLDEGSRTWVTYSIDAANPKAFTYHSSTTIPVTPMNFYWLNDSRTLMAVLTGGNTYIYAFNSSTGWTQTSTITDSIVEIGRDSLDRIWYVTGSEYGTTYPSIHLLTPSLPVTVDIVPASTNYTYAGSNINTTLTLNAINASGSRIATNVKVVIEGASMTFADGTTVKTVTTSSSADTTVNVIITGAGYTNVTASIEI